VNPSTDALIHVHYADHVPEGLTSPDVFFTPGYGRALTFSEGGEWVLLEAFDGAWQAPLILRTLADGTKDAISPHFSGIYAAPSLSAEQLDAAWSATVSRLRELGVISLLLRHSPHVPQAPRLPGQQSIVSGHPTIALEPADSDSAWTGLVSTCRTRIRKALKNGYTADVRAASSQDLAPGSDFRRLYELTMHRLDAAPVYFFGDDYYRTLLEGLGENLLIAEVRNAGGVPVSDALLMRHGPVLHYHLTGSSPDDARLGTNNLMVWAATKFAADQGIEQFHLGGGSSQRDSVFKFKSTFGGREFAYDISGLIIDQGLYQRQVENRARDRHTTSHELLAANFFPAYRGDRVDA
jgi:lipid II:glycine glycyltransferase (peptidoglycan interpeptide bridge formation enzyme)